MNYEIRNTSCTAGCLSVYDIIAMAEQCCNLSVDEMRSKSRKSELATARHFLCYVMFHHGFSHRECGDMINRDRTTAIYSIKKFKDLLDVGDKYASELWQSYQIYILEKK